MLKNTILLLLILLIVGCSKPNEENLNKFLEVETRPDQISYETEVFFIDSSYTKAILYAPKASVYNKKAETVLEGGINVRFLSEYTGERISFLTADSAIIDDNTKNMLAKGNVYVYSDSSQVELKTSVLNWNDKRQKLHSNEFVEITTPTEIIKGYGFESDLNLENYVIYKVSGIQNIK